MPNDLQTVTVGDVSTAYYPWPDNTIWPTTYVYPTTSTWIIPTLERDYANKVEVERGEHDAVLRFYRSREHSQELIKEITIPLGLLDWLAEKEG